MGDTERPRTVAPDLDLSGLRRDYGLGRLEEDQAPDGWPGLFARWFAEAGADPAVVEPNAVQLATAGPGGRASVRTVLVKSVSARGLIFYTNYDSAKGRDLAAVPWSAAVFAWLPQQRQVRFSGPTARVSRAETAAYFAQRPRGSQIGAWASDQGAVVGGRADLDEAVARTERRFDGVDSIPPPPDWGGYLLSPVEVEFWQGRPDRMHDRIRFRLGTVPAATIPDGSVPDTGSWRTDRLAP